jgi:hypothetical protein
MTKNNKWIIPIIIGLIVLFTFVSPKKEAIVGCVDNDGGMNAYVKSYVDYSGDVYFDSCKSSTVLYEYVCSAGRPDKREMTNLPNYECKNGILVKTGSVVVTHTYMCGDGTSQYSNRNTVYDKL